MCIHSGIDIEKMGKYFQEEYGEKAIRGILAMDYKKMLTAILSFTETINENIIPRMTPGNVAHHASNVKSQVQDIETYVKHIEAKLHWLESPTSRRDS
ncbi:MAG: hypothetical protein KAW12_11120 [Candidatus Aminicenantes bacterium]|nr:hypothetical protein [Candidatus Aminicenantes bacterium]